jgi:hypothetical protein
VISRVDYNSLGCGNPWGYVVIFQVAKALQKIDDFVEMHGVAKNRLRPNREQGTSPRVPVSSGKSFVII